MSATKEGTFNKPQTTPGPKPEPAKGKSAGERKGTMSHEGSKKGGKC